jgi:GNAT superfamily N-acetyltransferase
MKTGSWTASAGSLSTRRIRTPSRRQQRICARCYLEDLFVREGERRHGYGRALLEALAEVCVRRGYRRFEWSVLDWNEPSIRFYRSIGAVGMDKWKIQRLSGDALARLANS